MSVARTLPLLIALTACSTAPDKVCPAPFASAGTPGDVNGDAFVDIADPVALQRHLFMGDADPACAEAADIAPGAIDGGDPLSLLAYLYDGTAPLPAADDVACDAAPAPVEAPCGRVGWAVEAPSRAVGAAGTPVSVTATIGIHNHDLDPGPSAWSLGVKAEGCTLESATVEGTVADVARAGGVGWITEGYADVDVVDGGVVSVGILSWLERKELPPAAAPWPVLRVQLAGTAPAGGCVPCTVSLVDGLVGDGQPVATVLSASGARYAAEPVSHEIPICAP